MAKHWAVSDGLVEVIRQAVANYVRKVPPDFPYYPSIMWALGGEAFRPGEPSIKIPAGYTLGVIRQDEIGHFIAIADATFGYIAFQPRKDDLESTRRLIDDDCETIIVR